MMSDWTIDPGWVITAFTAMFTSSSGLVVWIGNDFRSRLNKCETKHESHNLENVQMARELADVKGELRGIKYYTAPELAKNVSIAVVETLEKKGVLNSENE